MPSIAAWRDQGIAAPVVTVNVSAAQFRVSPDLDREVADILAKWQVTPYQIELELTESVLLEATQKYNFVLERLRELGIRLGIDDFGTGYSSLKYLATYPLNRLKLAQELVFRVTVDYRNAAVVRNAIRLAHELGIEVMAEGVETDAQARFPIEAGCERAQGFYFSPPLTVDAVTVILREDYLKPARRTGQPLRISAA